MLVSSRLARIATTRVPSLQRTTLPPHPLTHSGPQQQQPQRAWLGTKVRVIVTEELEHGKGYPHDVIEVKAGFARNYLIPKKKVVYATRANFKKFHLKDPLLETPSQKAARLATVTVEDRDKKEADKLRKYLSNKTLKIWRRVDPEKPENVQPGLVHAKNVRDKLSKQLLIDLHRKEKVHLRLKPLPEDIQYEELDDLFQELGDPDTPCDVAIRTLGDYVARITLKGPHYVPLKFTVVKKP